MNPLPLDPFLTRPAAMFGKPVCRLGLAKHLSTGLTSDDVLYAVDQGMNFLNWPAFAEGEVEGDAFSEAIASLGVARERVVVCVQFGSATASDAGKELRGLLSILRTDHIDVLTLYYVEREEEWRQLQEPGGALGYLLDARRDGVVRRLGVTSHQRPLAAEMARSGLLDCVMIRYNAAHRGAERDIFPTTDELGVPVIAYTATRWGALMQ